MLRNYLKIAWRNLIKNKTFSVINILGLAIGLSCFLLIALYIMDELSFDRYNTNAARIYRIKSDIRFGGSDLKLPVTSDMMGQVLKKDYPQVEQYTRLYAQGGLLIKKDGQFISEQNLIWADSTFFEVFTAPAITGDTKTALNEPNTVVVTETVAKKYFNTTDAVGKVLQTNDEGGTDYKITAVIKDLPRNSHFRFNMIFSMDNVKYGWGQYLSHNFYTYLLLKEGTDAAAFEKKFNEYTKKYVLPQAAQYMQITSMDEFEKAGNKLVYALTPLTSIHFEDRNFDLSPAGNMQYIYIFGAVALFILLIACVNFMNLTTARSAKRAKEVGIRKVLGTERKNLVFQFLTESVLMVVLSLVLALGITLLVLPVFNGIASKSIVFSDLFTPYLLPFIIALPFVVGILAGSYPALYLSAFRPIMVLKGFMTGKKTVGLRSVLVVGQFSISIILIISTVIIYNQLNYIQHKNLGFNKDQVLVINNAYTLKNNAEVFKTEMLKETGVTGATLSGFLPINSSRNDNTISSEPVMTSKTGLNLQVWRIDEDYISTMGMQIVKGRNFLKDFKSDSSAVIINEAAAKLLNMNGDITGKKIYKNWDNTNATIPLNVIGVVKDFHFASLRENIGPLCFILGRNTGMVSFKVSAANIPAVIKAAEAKWKTMAPGMPFSYQFMDEGFNEMYRSEQRVGTLALVFAILAISIACLGLFGLATFIAEQRTKEIGIRKILGASISGVVRLLSKDFLKLVAIAFIIATPVGWYCMHKWLQDFAYRVKIDWWVFAIAGITALVIALLTVSFQAIKAAIANPVKSLRTE